MVDERVIQKLERWINKLLRSLFVQKATPGPVGQGRSEEDLGGKKCQRWPALGVKNTQCEIKSGFPTRRSCFRRSWGVQREGSPFLGRALGCSSPATRAGGRAVRALAACLRPSSASVLVAICSTWKNKPITWCIKRACSQGNIPLFSFFFIHVAVFPMWR